MINLRISICQNIKEFLTKFIVIISTSSRRKKKCIRYMETISSGKDDCYQELDDLNDNSSEGNLGSPESVDDNNKTSDDDIESLNHSIFSQGCLSGLSSLQSPSTSLTSPLNLLASPPAPVTVGLQFDPPHHPHQQNGQSQQQLFQQQTSQQTQQQLIRRTSVVDASTLQRARLQHQQQLGHRQVNFNQRQQHLQQHLPHAHTSPMPTNSNIFEHTKTTRPFLCCDVGGITRGGGVAGALMTPNLPNSVSSKICFGNTLTTSLSSTAATVAGAALTERTMSTLLNPSPSTFILNRNCFQPSSLKASSGTIVSTAQVLSNNSNKTTSLNASTSKYSSPNDIPLDAATNYTKFGTTCSSNECNSHSSSSNINVSFSNAAKDDNYERGSSAMITLQTASHTVNKPVPTIDGKSAVSSSASSTTSSPTTGTFEKLSTHRNPIGTEDSLIAGMECQTSASFNVSNGVTQQYKNCSHQFQKLWALRLPTAATQHKHLAVPPLLPPAPQQQLFHLRNTSLRPTLPSPMYLHTHHHAHQLLPHTPLFDEHFQQFSHHLASVAAVAVAAAGVHMPNIISAAVVGTSNSIHRSCTNEPNERNIPNASRINEAMLPFTKTPTVTAPSNESIEDCSTQTMSSDVLTPFIRHMAAATTGTTTEKFVDVVKRSGEKGAIGVT